MLVQSKSNNQANSQSGVNHYVKQAKYYGKLAGAALITGEVLIRAKTGISLVGTTYTVLSTTYKLSSAVFGLAWQYPRQTGLLAGFAAGGTLFNSGLKDWENADSEDISFCQRCSLTVKSGAKIAASAGVTLGTAYIVCKL